MFIMLLIHMSKFVPIIYYLLYNLKDYIYAVFVTYHFVVIYKQMVMLMSALRHWLAINFRKVLTKLLFITMS